MKTTPKEKTAERPWELGCVLPAQFIHASGRSRSPEMRLAAAVFEDAFHCVTRADSASSRTRRHDFVEARQWFLDDSREWPFAFVNVCDILALDAEAVRQRLQRIVATHEWNPGNIKSLNSVLIPRASGLSSSRS